MLAHLNAFLQKLFDILIQIFCTIPYLVKSKTKCIIFSKKHKDLIDVAPLLLNGDPLPLVQQVKHLDNVQQSELYEGGL